MESISGLISSDTPTTLHCLLLMIWKYGEVEGAWSIVLFCFLASSQLPFRIFQQFPPYSDKHTYLASFIGSDTCNKISPFPCSQHQLTSCYMLQLHTHLHFVFGNWQRWQNATNPLMRRLLWIRYLQVCITWIRLEHFTCFILINACSKYDLLFLLFWLRPEHFCLSSVDGEKA